MPNFRTVDKSGGAFDWSDPNNWDTSQIPANGDNVSLPAGTPNVDAYASLDDMSTLSLGNIDISNGVTFVVASSSTLVTSTLSNSGSIDVDGSLTVQNINSNSGTIDVQSGGSFEVTNLNGDAFVIEDGGTLTLQAGGNINGTPTLYLQGGLLDFLNQTGGNATVDFTGNAAGHLEITTQQVTNNNNPTLTQWGLGDSVEFGNATITQVQYDTGTHILTVTANNTPYNISIASFDDSGASTFTFGTDPVTGHADAVAVCYYRGTGIRTPSGDVAVESLIIGDELVTADGRVMPVRWIGRNTVSTKFADPLRVLPIRIAAGALADHLPERDLLVSPEHAVLVDDVLIQAGALVNGLSIVRESNVPETFVYYHIELAEHALVLAEGTPAESFVDNIDRTAFDNWEEHQQLYGDAPIAEMDYPRVRSYRQVPVKVRARLLHRAETMPAARWASAA